MVLGAICGLLLGAILSDTLNFQSPTTTEKDKAAKQAARKKVSK